MEESNWREINILKTMNHPLVVQICDCCSGVNSQHRAVVTEFVANGSLADHLSDGDNDNLCELSGSTRIMKIIAGIVLAMCYIHSRGIIHRDLTPDNILLDLDWNVRICAFGQSVSANQPQLCSPNDRNEKQVWPSTASRYTAPECYYDITVLESDVFSFGMILYELIVGRPAFPKDMDLRQIAAALVLDNWRLHIPDTVIPVTARLIRDCLAVGYRDRPSFTEILQRLEMRDFKLIPGVNSAEITEFVAAVEYWEYLGSIHDPDETSKATSFVNAGLFDERIHRLIKFHREHRKID
jgi:serine/threonine protein kinase